jgi:MoaA/NifB/PqqE/SkfB family radical SAM enzyme
MNISQPKVLCFLLDYGIHRGCNLACQYCRTSSLSEKKVFKDDKDLINKYIKGITNVSRYVDAVMFKTSGWGEITQLPGYKRLFHHAREIGYEVLQLITNGTVRFTERNLEELNNLGYFSIQISIDGLTASENIYREPKALRRILYNLELSLEIGIPIEINTVLSDANTMSLKPFFDYLLCLREKYNTQLVCVPRRVRVKPSLNNFSHLPKSNMFDELENIMVNSYSTYECIFPPKEYLLGLIYYLRNDERYWKCYDSCVRTNIGSSGDIVIHTKDGNQLLGSIFTDDCSKAFDARYKLHSVTGDLNYQLKMNQFDIHYMYFSGLISSVELSKIPSCNSPPAIKRLKYIRDLIINSVEK